MSLPAVGTYRPGPLPVFSPDELVHALPRVREPLHVVFDPSTSRVGLAVAPVTTQVLQRDRHAFYLATVDRLRRELYSTPPPIVVKTAIRYLMTDPVYHERYFQFATRAIPPERLQIGKLLAGSIARGLVRDLRGEKSLPPPV